MFFFHFNNISPILCIISSVDVLFSFLFCFHIYLWYLFLIFCMLVNGSFKLFSYIYKTIFFCHPELSVKKNAREDLLKHQAFMSLSKLDNFWGTRTLFLNCNKISGLHNHNNKSKLWPWVCLLDATFLQLNSLGSFNVLKSDVARW